MEAVVDHHITYTLIFVIIQKGENLIVDCTGH